jgi:quinol monooxygenase YgiN
MNSPPFSAMIRPSPGAEARMHVVVWEFTVRSEHIAAFEAAYGPAGAWVALFRRAPAWLGTELLAGGSGRYLTLDRWRDRAAYDAFRQSAAADYAALDAACEALTAAEREIGAFDTVDAP